MPWMTDLERVKADEAARSVVEAHLVVARATLRALDEGKHREALHDVRVAMRRLVSAMRAFGKLLPLSKRHGQRLRRLAKATNRARDLEVELAWLRRLRTDAPDSLEAELTGYRRRCRQEAKRAASKLAAELPKLLRRIEAALRVDRGAGEFVPSFGCVVAGLTRLQMARLVCRLERPSLDDEALHRVRLDAKQLRYLMEPLVSFTPETKRAVQRWASLQTQLGKMRDRHVFSLHARRRTQDGASSDVGPWLEQRAQAELATEKREFMESWLGEGGSLATLRAETERLVSELESASDMEVERKYLLRSLPSEARLESSTEILQGWIPGERIHERLRRIEAHDGSVSHRRTLKLGRGLSRVEVEEEIDAELFEQMWPLTSGKRVHKRRYFIARQALVWEVDEFLDRDLILAELELPSPSSSPPMPDWLSACLVRDVTKESTYVNLLLAR